jgi:hypothetical protein
MLSALIEHGNECGPQCEKNDDVERPIDSRCEDGMHECVPRTTPGRCKWVGEALHIVVVFLQTEGQISLFGSELKVFTALRCGYMGRRIK